MIILKIPLRPVSSNKMYRVSKSGHIYKPKEIVEFEQQVRKLMSEQYNDKILDGNCAITLKICLTGNKPIDLDNCMRMVINALQGIVIKNDAQIVGISAHRQMNCEADKITISITDINY